MSAPQIATGQILNNRYRVVRMIGEGGMGQVYVAEDLSGAEPVALKVIREGLEDSDRRRFEREIRILQTLDHPHVVAFRDLGLWGSTIFYTMDLHSGPSLEHLLAGREHGVQTSEELNWFLKIVMQVAEALQYLHQRRIIHRDVKPSNILLRLGGTESPDPIDYLGRTGVSASLTDFGLVKTRDGDGALTRTTLGTPQYMAPEQIENASAADERSDLYSLGVILYRIATGHLPYQRLSDALSRRPPPPARELNEKLPELLESVLARLLEFEAHRRPTSTDEAIELLRSVLDRRVQASTDAVTITKLTQPTFSGREAPLTTLRERAKLTARGQGSWVSITGERGSGKSWLVGRSDFKSHSLIQAGLTVYQGTFVAAQPHSGFQQVLLSVLRHIDRHHERPKLLETLGRWGRHLASLFPQLQFEGWLEGCPEVESEVPPEILKERVFQTVIDVLASNAELEPRALVLEDVHYGDDFDLELLRRLILNCIQLPVLVVTTHRPEFHGRLPALERLLLEIRSEERLIEIEMQPFDRDETRAMVSSMLAPARQIRDELVDVLRARTDGVPLYLLHLVNSLWNRSLVDLRGDYWEVDLEAVRALPIPESTRSHFLLVLDEMDPLELKVLHLAAVLGPTFAFDVLLAVLDIDEFELDQLCKNLVFAGILEEHQDGFRFLRPFEQEIILSRLSQPMRRRLHARVARVLAEHYGETSEKHIGEIADHMYRGGDHDNGVRYLQRAAEQAERAYATRAALEYNQKALELCQDPAVRPQLLVALGDQHLKLGELDRAIQRFREAIGHFTQVERHLLQRDPVTNEQCHALGNYVRLLIKFGEVSVRKGDYEPAGENFRKAEQIARRIDAKDDIALCLVRQAATFAYVDDFEKASAAYHEAIALYQHLSAGPGLASAWGGLAAVEKVRGNLSEALSCLQRGLAISEEVGDELQTARLLTNLGNLHRNRGRMDDAVASFERAIELRQRLGDRQGMTVSLMNLGRTQVLLGDLRLGLDALTRAQTAFEALGDKRGLLLCLGNLASTHYYLGDFDTSESLFTRYLKDSERSGVPRGIADACLGLGTLQLGRGDIEAAERYFERSLTSFERAGDREGAHRNRIKLAEVRMLQGRLDEALELCQLDHSSPASSEEPDALPLTRVVEAGVRRLRGDLEGAERLALEAFAAAEQQDIVLAKGHSSLAAGMVYRDMGFYYADKAARFFDRALAAFERMGASHLIAITQLEYGIFLGLVDEVEQAREFLSRAATVFHSQRAQRHLERIQREMAELT
ncbi:MAG: serine/threonine-protein kinase PknK [Planctomycetota bacterium]